MRVRQNLWIAFAACLLVACGARAAPAHAAAPEARASQFEATVRRVVAGNEVELDDGTRLRYIGVQVPKLDHAYASVRSVARRARAENRRFVEGRRVRVETDVAREDRRGRLLGYVFVDDRCVNAELIRMGWAMAEKTPANNRRYEEFRRMEAEAKALGRGIWGSEAEFGLYDKLERRRGEHPDQDPRLREPAFP